MNFCALTRILYFVWIYLKLQFIELDCAIISWLFAGLLLIFKCHQNRVYFMNVLYFFFLHQKEIGPENFSRWELVPSTSASCHILNLKRKMCYFPHTSTIRSVLGYLDVRNSSKNLSKITWGVLFEKRRMNSTCTLSTRVIFCTVAIITFISGQKIPRENEIRLFQRTTENYAISLPNLRSVLLEIFSIVDFLTHCQIARSNDQVSSSFFYSIFQIHYYPYSCKLCNNFIAFFWNNNPHK